MSSDQQSKVEFDFRGHSDAALATMLLAGEGGYVLRDAAVADPGNRAELDRLIAIARELWERRLIAACRQRPVLNSPALVREFLRSRLTQLEHEVFVVLFLDSQNHLLGIEELFRGTLTQASVYPRELVKRALAHNAGGVICAHNHPSGVAEPSRADELLTRSLKEALALVDVRLLDHMIVGAERVTSLAERGLI